MGFSFLAPLFLVGLAALAVPVAIHLTHRQRREAIAFPSLMFLRQIPFRTTRRQRIRHWTLFLLRSLAIVLAVSAFARPLLERSGGAALAFREARELVLLLDRSHSMAYGDRWGRALLAARRSVDRMGPEDRATLVLVDGGTEVVSQRTGDPAALRAALASADVGWGVTRYGPALRLAGEIVARSDRPGREVVLIGDFQRSAWHVGQAVRLPAGTDLRTVDLSEPPAANLAVTDASLFRTREAGRELITVAARVANLAAEPVDAVPLVLEVDGREVEARSVRLDAGETAVVRFAPFTTSDRPLRGVVRAGSDRLPADDTYRFVAQPVDPVRVLIVRPPRAGRNQDLYLRRALELGNQPGFELTVRSVTQLRPEELEAAELVVLNDAPLAGGALVRGLRGFVETGGGLLVVLGRRSAAGAWAPELEAWLPAAVGNQIDRVAAGGAMVGYLDYDHPALRIFRAPRSGDFSNARFLRYRDLQSREGTQVLARFDDGALALAEARRGEGRVVVWASGLENYWNDLAVQPVFLPLVHQMAKHLSGYEEPPAAFRVPKAVDLALTAGAAALAASGSELVVERPGGGRQLLGAAESRYIELREPGFYQVRAVRENAEAGVALAANLDPAESDLAPLDSEELRAAVTSPEGGVVADLETVTLSAEELERRQGGWWYLLLAAVAFLLAETVLSNRKGRGALAATGV